MYVPTVAYPGTRLELEDQNQAFQIEMLLGFLESSLVDAAISLHHFESSSTELKAVLGVGRRRPEESRHPERHLHRAPFVHARSFIYSLYDIARLLDLVAAVDGVPQGTKDAVAEFDASFPDLKGVRDSAQHFDERIQGKARKRPLKPGTPLWFGNLGGNQYEEAMENGKIGRVEVSRESLDKSRDVVQSVINTFEWR